MEAFYTALYATEDCKDLDCITAQTEDKMTVLREIEPIEGRLVFFLAETLHDVTAHTAGPRQALFMWLACDPDCRCQDHRAYQCPSKCWQRLGRP